MHSNSLPRPEQEKERLSLQASCCLSLALPRNADTFFTPAWGTLSYFRLKDAAPCQSMDSGCHCYNSQRLHNVGMLNFQQYMLWSILGNVSLWIAFKRNWSLAWWCTPVVPGRGKLGQANREVKVSLDT